MATFTTVAESSASLPPRAPLLSTPTHRPPRPPRPAPNQPPRLVCPPSLNPVLSPLVPVPPTYAQSPLPLPRTVSIPVLYRNKPGIKMIKVELELRGRRGWIISKKSHQSLLSATLLWALSSSATASFPRTPSLGAATAATTITTTISSSSSSSSLLLLPPHLPSSWPSSSPVNTKSNRQKISRRTNTVYYVINVFFSRERLVFGRRPQLLQPSPLPSLLPYSSPSSWPPSSPANTKSKIKKD